MNKTAKIVVGITGVVVLAAGVAAVVYHLIEKKRKAAELDCYCDSCDDFIDGECTCNMDCDSCCKDTEEDVCDDESEDDDVYEDCEEYAEEDDTVG